MALGRKTLLLLTIFYIVITTLNILTQSQQVPCLFFFGDSLLDNGNNNLLLTRAKVNYKPYGIDYPDGPTGRFSNGRNQADFLAQLLGFNESIPPFANATGSEILKGVNYASGVAGIRDETGQNMGDRISLNRQLQSHRTTISRITGSLIDPIKVNSYLNKCLYVVNIGSNDYLNNYLLPKLYPTSRMFTPQLFASALIQQYTGQLKTLYNYGARKIAIFGLGLLGCTPQELAMNPIHGPCVDFIDNDVQLFNNMLKTLVDNLNKNLIGSHFIYINTNAISLAAPAVIGIKVTNVSCCAVSSNGLCIANKVSCANRSKYSFWDNFHPTEVLNQAIATSAYNGTLPSDTYPYNIRRLALHL